MNFCRVWLVIGVLCTVFLGSVVPTEAELKAPVIAVVDVQMILQQSAASQSIRAAIAVQRETYAREIAEQETQLRDAEQALALDRATLGEQAFIERRREFERRITDVQRAAQRRKQALDQAFNRAMTTVRQTLLETVAAVAQDSGANVVLSKQQVIIIEKTLDITSVVLERLNRALPEVAVEIEPG